MLATVGTGTARQRKGTILPDGLFDLRARCGRTRGEGEGRIKGGWGAYPVLNDPGEQRHPLVAGKAVAARRHLQGKRKLGDSIRRGKRGMIEHLQGMRHGNRRRERGGTHKRSAEITRKSGAFDNEGARIPT
eukprot:6290261-Pyramimonas_sp.AAC.1